MYKCFLLTFLLQLQNYTLSSIHVVDTAVDIDSRPIFINLFSIFPHLYHACGGMSICMSVEAVLSVCFINSNVLVRQVELNGGFGVSDGHTDTLHAFSHYCTL